MPTMCLKFVSEEGLAHISESPLPVDFTATTTAGVALPVDVTTVNEPLDGILC